MYLEEGQLQQQQETSLTAPAASKSIMTKASSAKASTATTWARSPTTSATTWIQVESCPKAADTATTTVTAVLPEVIAVEIE